MNADILINALNHLPKTVASIDKIKFNNCIVIFDAFRRGEVLTSIYDPVITSDNPLWLVIKMESIKDILQIGDLENKSFDIVVDNNFYTGILSFVSFRKKIAEIILS